MSKTLSINLKLKSEDTSASESNSTQHQSNGVNGVKVNKNPQPEVNPAKVQLPPDVLQIIHATAGRVRIRAIDAEFNSQLEVLGQRLKQQTWVRETTINHNSSSLILSFDAQKVPLSAVLTLLQVWGVSLVRTGEKNHPLAPWQSREFWQNQFITLIPLLVGLGVTGALRIRGLAAIPVYIIAADLTQWFLTSGGTNQPVSTQVHEEIPMPKQEAKLSDISEKVSYKILHQIPGRVRLHIPLIAEDRVYAQRLKELLQSHAQVTDVRVNIPAASVAIAFSPDAKLSMDDLLYFLESAWQSPPING